VVGVVFDGVVVLLRVWLSRVSLGCCSFNVGEEGVRSKRKFRTDDDTASDDGADGEACDDGPDNRASDDGAHGQHQLDTRSSCDDCPTATTMTTSGASSRRRFF